MCVCVCHIYRCAHSLIKCGTLSLQLAGKATDLVQGVMKQTYKTAEECLNTNYYGVKRVTEVLLPLLQLSPSGARIVNVSSLRSELRVSHTTIFS